MKIKKNLKMLLSLIIITSFFYICMHYKTEIIKFTNNIKEKTMTTLSIEDNNTIYDELIDVQITEDPGMTKQNYYYYSCLDYNAKLIYTTLENNIDKINNGEDNIPLPSSFSKIAKQEGGEQIISQAFQNAWDALSEDKPELYYIDGNKMCLVSKKTTKGANINYEFYISKGDNANYFEDKFKSYSDVEATNKKIEEVTNEITKNISGNTYNKILKVHDWIIENLKYDETYNLENNEDIYGGLINHTVICEGYAETFKYLLDKLDVPCIIICGNATDSNGNQESHAWNYVYLDQKWYAIDTTWDDPVIVGNGTPSKNRKYKYFLKSTQTMQTDHTATGVVTTGGFIFKYPELNTKDFEAEH